jgi:hypothetical protein
LTEPERPSQPIVIEEIQRGLASLNEQPWDFTDGFGKNPFVFLFFSLAYWTLTGTATELSIRVFLRGLKFMFVRPMVEENPENGENRAEVQLEPVAVMTRIEPLLSKVPKSLITQALAIGANSDDPSLRALCRLFASVGTDSSRTG